MSPLAKPFAALVATPGFALLIAEIIFAAANPLEMESVAPLGK
jgi:hypothetical protein